MKLNCIRYLSGVLLSKMMERYAINQTVIQLTNCGLVTPYSQAIAFFCLFSAKPLPKINNDLLSIGLKGSPVKFQSKHSHIFFQKNAFENVTCKVFALVFQVHYVISALKSHGRITGHLKLQHLVHENIFLPFKSRYREFDRDKCNFVAIVPADGQAHQAFVGI